MPFQAVEFTPFLASVPRNEAQIPSMVPIRHSVTQYALDLSQSSNIVV
jgi:hypothetical protein